MKHDKPATPYQRLIRSEYISEQKKNELSEIYNSLNPFVLKKAVRKKVDSIFRLININSVNKVCHK